MDLERITVEATPNFTGLNKDSVQNYFKAKFSLLPLLKNRVINPFEELLKDYTGYSKNNLPNEVTETSLQLGDIDFTIKSEKRIKRPRLIEIYEGYLDYLEFLQDGHSKNIRRKGVRTFNDRPYILLDEVFSKLDELRQIVTENEVKHSLKNTFSEEYSGSIVIPLSYKIMLNESGALTYVHTKEIIKDISSNTVKNFEDCLKQQTGYHKNNPPKEMDTKWTQINNHLFQIQSIPEETVKYAGIVNDLLKENKKLAPSTGDLIRIRDGFELAEDTASLYQPKNFRKNMYVSIEGAMERLKGLKMQNTNTSLNQKISYYPAV